MTKAYQEQSNEYLKVSLLSLIVSHVDDSETDG